MSKWSSYSQPYVKRPGNVKNWQVFVFYDQMIESLELMLDGKGESVLVTRLFNVRAIDCCVLVPWRWK
jgi:hypothetical protein